LTQDVELQITVLSEFTDNPIILANVHVTFSGYRVVLLFLMKDKHKRKLVPMMPNIMKAILRASIATCLSLTESQL
jgi:1,4-dihydroxy-2-naphthoate octaprenyltransferase